MLGVKTTCYTTLYIEIVYLCFILEFSEIVRTAKSSRGNEKHKFLPYAPPFLSMAFPFGKAHFHQFPLMGIAQLELFEVLSKGT